MDLIVTQHDAAPFNEAAAPELAHPKQSIHRRNGSTPTTMTSLEPFERARKRVWEKLMAKEQNELVETCTIKDVWKVAVDIQEKQAKQRKLGNMNKIKPYLDGLKYCDGIIGVFVSSNPGILALIWVGCTHLNPAVQTDGRGVRAQSNSCCRFGTPHQ